MRQKKKSLAVAATAMEKDTGLFSPVSVEIELSKDIGIHVIGLDDEIRKRN